jgi:hypothetical protein
MSRHGYTEDCWDFDQWHQICWRGAVAASIRGKRGQRLLLDVVRALDAMPEKRLIAGEMVRADGAVCALGAVARHRGILSTAAAVDPEDSSTVAGTFDVAEPLAREITYINDEHGATNDPEKRWRQMREWCIGHLRPV